MSGHRTRGKSRAGRLRLVDRFIADRLGTMDREGALFVDVGLGAHPDTTLEWRAASRADVLGVEIDTVRVQTARDAGLDVLEGGFEVVPDCAVVRAINLFRQYAREDVQPAVEGLLRRAPVVLWGSTDKHGETAAFWVQERERRRLVLAYDGPGERFAPRRFFRVLPRDLQAPPRVGHPLWDVLSAWEQAWRPVRGGQDAFAASLRSLPWDRGATWAVVSVS